MDGVLGGNIVWSYTRPDHHITGQTRIMTGVLLTHLGRHIALLYEAELKRSRDRS
jgi:hypothetical protein